MKKAFQSVLRILLTVLSLLTILSTVGYFYIAFHTQTVIGLVQSLAENVTNTKNSYEPLSAPLSDDKSNGQYLITNINYTEEYPNSFLDIQYPDRTRDANRPTLIYLHGGGYMYGSKSSGDPLAATEITALIDDICDAGYNIVNIDYAFVPDYRFPTPLKQVTLAFSYLMEHCEEYALNMDSIVIMGSSAGAIMTSQLGSLITSSEYADLLDLSPVLSKTQVKALVIDDAPLDYSNFGLATKLIIGNYLSGTIYPDKHLLRQYNNITSLTSDYIPCVLLAGEYYRDMRLMSDTLNQCNVENLLLDPLNETGVQQPHCYLALERSDPVAKNSFEQMIAFLNAKTAH